MNYKIYFSPTGGTKKVVDFIGNQFESGKDIDISAEITEYHMDENDFCIVGVPSFGGRVPAIAAERLRQIHGSKTPALLVVTYGNRAYEDTLIELKDILEAQGFLCIGAMAVVTMHSIMNQYGKGKPTDADFQEIGIFLEKVKARLASEHISIEVPGNRPYKELKVSALCPVATDDCKECGLCAEKCPVHAISEENLKAVDTGKCISCMRCVSICPRHARECNSSLRQALADRLKSICSVEKKNEFY